MRRVLPLLLLLAACEPRRDPRAIERVLSAKTIDLEALEDLLRVEEGALRLVEPGIEGKYTSPPSLEWILENVGRRPVWLRRDDLKVRVTFTPFVIPECNRGRLYGGRRTAVARPSFAPEEWVLLERGERLRLPLEAAIAEPGAYELSVRVGNHGRDLCCRAADFNAGRVLSRSGPEGPLFKTSDALLLLPPAPWPGAPWHGTESLDPRPIGGRRFELHTDVDRDFETSDALPLEAFVLSAEGTVVHAGPLQVEAHEGQPVPASGERPQGFFRNRAVYGVPKALPPGEYRILVRAENADPHFTSTPHRCSNARGAASRWVPFRVE